MEAFSVVGGERLSGEARVGAAKNAVLPLLAACLLMKEPVMLCGCPRLSDIADMCALLQSLGCRAQREGEDLIVDAGGACGCVMPEALSKRMRSSIFMLGPVLSRFGQAVFTYPGGCEIGLRPVDLHLSALRALGARVEEERGHILCRGTLRGGAVHLDYPSVGATENARLAAVCARGESVICNAAREPEIADLARFLNACGGRVRGAGTGTIRIEGVARLTGRAYTPLPDRICAGTLLLAAAGSGGEIYVRDARPQDLTALLHKLREAGAEVKCGREAGVHLRLRTRPRAVRRIETAPFPGFATDLQAPMMALLTRGQGTSLIVENVFESRMSHAAELGRMGADIQVSGRAAVVRGVPRLSGARVTARDLRAGAALCIAALMAEGESLVENVALIDRGYERLEEKLAALGARIRRLPGGEG